MSYFFSKTLVPIFISFLLPILVIAQKDEILRIDRVTERGVLLKKGWKYNIGDDLAWAKPEYDDKGWKNIDPTQEIAHLPQIFNEEIKWLRLSFEITNHLPLPLGIAINQAGASEIYLNGRLIHRIGHFDTNIKNVVAYDPNEAAIHFPAPTPGRYVLAIRYVLQPNIRYTNVFTASYNSFFKATIVDLIPTLYKQKSDSLFYSGVDIFTVGVVFLLFVLHTALYFYHRDNQLQLGLCIYLLLAWLTRVLKVIGQNQNFVEDRFWVLNGSNLLLSISILCMTYIIYRMANMRLDRYYYIVIIYHIVYIMISITVYGSPVQRILLLIASFYSFFVLIRVVKVGYYNRIKGFLVLGIAISLSLLGLILISSATQFLGYKLTYFGFTDLKYGFSPYVITLVFNAGFIAIPVGLSLFMGIQGRETNKALKKQLDENDELKNKALEYEHEKQYLLASQNEILEKLVTERTAELNHSLEKLQNTQNQLVQSEKLASLGELTAGIAHEIQNPLNFVNNFAELSVDLAKDLNEEIQKSDMDRGYVEELLNDLTLNQSKIQHHGKRASNIVKGMLAHSRANTGGREWTDINKLADEYLRLSYHGLRAKDKSFNANFQTDFDKNLPLVEVAPQEIGRVLLNLYNNAFYAVNDKKTKDTENTSYQPTVIVSTQKVNQQVIIKVRDNGIGMPETVRAKVFQPFFTTKPAGHGTGLGLSISYDIITKGHGGSFEIETKEGEFTEFIIRL